MGKEEDFLKSKGWELVKGYKLDHSMFDEDYDYSYWTDTSDLLEECEFWNGPDKRGNELATEDIDLALELAGYEEDV